MDKVETELLLRTGRGDAQAFSDLYDRVSGVLYSLAISILKDATAAEDLLQDVFVQVWEKAHSFNPDLGKPMTWLVTLTRNRAVDRLRAAQRSQRLIESIRDEPMLEPPADPPQNVHWLVAETAGAVRKALGQLPEDQRQALELAYFRGLTQTEIAQLLDTPLGTVKARIRRGMLHMREHLKEY